MQTDTIDLSNITPGTKVKSSDCTGTYLGTDYSAVQRREVHVVAWHGCWEGTLVEYQKEGKFRPGFLGSCELDIVAIEA